MELRDVKIFLALSEELHFSRAAKRLYLSQGRVSQAIRALEREVGGELFERTSRQVRLTAIGRRFAAGARQGHDTLMRTLRDCQAMARAERGRLRIGYSATVGGGFAAEVAEAFEAHHPEFMVTVNAIRVFRLNSALDNDEADVILAWSPGGSGEALRSMDLTVGPVLAQVQRGLLLPDDHPLASRCEVSLDDIADYELLWPPDAIATPELLDLWVPHFTHSGRPLKRAAMDLVAMTGRREIVADDVVTLVARRYGLHLTVTTLLDRLPHPRLTVIPINDIPPMAIVPVWSPDTENSTVRAFIDSLTAVTGNKRRTSLARTA